MRTTLTCNNMEALLGAVIAGLGIGCMPDFLAREALERGALDIVLADHTAGLGLFRLLWPSSRHLSPKVRVFADFLSRRLSEEGF